jgi:hypothetical protein
MGQAASIRIRAEKFFFYIKNWLSFMFYVKLTFGGIIIKNKLKQKTHRSQHENTCIVKRDFNPTIIVFVGGMREVHKRKVHY